MPHLKKEKASQPLWKEWDYAAQKKGFRNTIYSVNGDQYTGEWLDNLKHGTWFNCFRCKYCPRCYLVCTYT